MDQNSFSPIPKILKVKFKWFFSLSQFSSKQEKTFLVGELIFMWFLWKRKNYNQDGSDDWIMFRIWQFSIFWSTPWILLKFWESIQNDATKLWKKYGMLNQLLTVHHGKYKRWLYHLFKSMVTLKSPKMGSRCDTCMSKNAII